MSAVFAFSGLFKNPVIPIAMRKRPYANKVYEKIRRLRGIKIVPSPVA